MYSACCLGYDALVVDLFCYRWMLPAVDLGIALLPEAVVVAMGAMPEGFRTAFALVFVVEYLDPCVRLVPTRTRC